jgi:outer membrane murein-binding lipoprotein Lpp
MSEEIRELNQKVSSLVAELESASFDSRLEKEEAHRILQRLEQRLHRFEAEHLEDVLIQG